uniref:Uncharacterized protein n=1 Tax=Cacopsylla melanoneura TaxID=428564 RepID=A0A8D8M186_9HEMI
MTIANKIIVLLSLLKYGFCDFSEYKFCVEFFTKTDYEGTQVRVCIGGPVSTIGDCHSYKIGQSWAPAPASAKIPTTVLKSSEIRGITGYTVDLLDIVRRDKSHYIDVYALPDCKGTPTPLNKVCHLDNLELTKYNVYEDLFKYFRPSFGPCNTFLGGRILSFRMYPRYLPRELPLDYYKIKIIFDEGNNSTLENILIQNLPNVTEAPKQIDPTLAFDVVKLIPIPGLGTITDVGLVMLKLVEVSNGLQNDLGKIIQDLGTLMPHMTYHESTRRLGTDLKAALDLVVENTKQWNDTRRTEAERSVNADLIYHELFTAFSLIKHNIDPLYKMFPDFAVKPMFSLCTAMSFFIPKMPRWKEKKSDLRLIPLYKETVNQMRNILTKARLDKLELFTAESTKTFIDLYNETFEGVTKEVMNLPYNSRGYIGREEKLFCIDIGDKDHCTENPCLHDKVSKSTYYEVGVPEEDDIALPSHLLNPLFILKYLSSVKSAKYYIKQCFSGYAKLVRTRFEEAYNGVCNTDL